MAGTRPAIAHTHRSHQVMGAVECQLACPGRRSPHCRQLCSPRRWKSTGCRASQSWPQSASYRRVFVWLLLDCRDLCVWSMKGYLACNAKVGPHGHGERSLSTIALHGEQLHDCQLFITKLSHHSTAVEAVQAPSRTSRMLPAIQAETASQLQHSATQKAAVNSLKAAGSAPMMQKIASSTGNLHLYDDFLSKLQGSPSWPDDKEAVRQITPNETLPIEKYETDCCVQTILEPFTYISASPGKDMRSQLIDAFNIWLRVPLESLDIIKQVVAELHNASLL
jgi:hypothetical protein